MNTAILFRKKSKPSALALAKDLQSLGLEVSCFTPWKCNTKDFQCLVNVGNSIDVSHKNIINPPRSIRTSANKRLARIRFKAKNIPAPTLWLDYRKIPSCEYPVVGRTSYHMKAKGFWFCKNQREARTAKTKGATHFMKFIKNTSEFRCHCFSGLIHPKNPEDYKIVKISEKVITADTKDDIIKNHDHGYAFVHPRNVSSKFVPIVSDVAKLVLCKFGLHFGGIDIMYSHNTHKPYVLEINSTPCLTDENTDTSAIYAENVLNLVNQCR